MDEVDVKVRSDTRKVRQKSKKQNGSCSSDTDRTELSPFEKYTQYVRRNINMKLSESESVPTNCFGNIQFKETTKRTNARFIRCADDTDAEKLFTLFTKHWNLDRPSLLISVTGGAKSFNLSPQLTKDFQDGLLKVANTPGAWVISGGTNTGVMKLVGNAVHGTHNICIGIATWGIVANRDSLVPVEDPSSDERRSGKLFPYHPGSYLVQKNEAFLDYNHTHFILVDNGSDGEWGKEIELRGRFEDHIMQTANPKIPSVLIVLEGGPGTLNTVLKAVENSIPCVVVEGSGRAADVLVYAINSADQILEAVSKGEQHEGLYNEIQNRFKLQTACKKVLKLVLQCIQKAKPNLFTVVNVCGGMDTDDAILTALLKDTHTSPSHYEQMRLAIFWDRADLAESRIMSNVGEFWKARIVVGNQDEARAAEQELDELMIMALALNRVNFVKLLLGYGVSIKSLLTRKVLQFLYAYRRNMGLSTMRYKLTPSTMKNCDSKYKDFFETLQHCLGKRQSKRNKKVAQEIDLENVRKTLYELLPSIPKRFLENAIEIPDSDENTFDSPFRQLFLWSVFNNSLDMALVFWEFEDYPIYKALIAAEITNGLMKNVRPLDLQDEVEKSLQGSFNTYQKLSLDLLDLCYNTHEKNTELLITTNIDLLPDSSSCLDFAVALDQRDFVAHSCVQGILNDVLTGSIAQRHISGWKICAYISLPFLLALHTDTWNIEIRTQSEMKRKIRTRHFDDTDDEAEERSTRQLKRKVENSVFYANGRRKSVYSVNNTNTGRTDAMDDEEDQSKLRSDLSFCQKFYNFHVFSPIVRFYTHTLGYLLFLMLFSYIATLKKTSNVPSGLEVLLIITVVGYAVNEIYQLCHIDAPSATLKIKGYARDFWNQFDIVCLLVFFIAIVLRCIPGTVEYGHLFYAFDVSLWIVRLINILFIDPATGPYVVMIGHMFCDLLSFLLILLIFLLAYGVAIRGILNPSPDDARMLVSSVFKPYFNWHGEYFLDAPDDDNTTYFGTKKRNSYAEPIALIYMALYLLIVNILLLNLVIAIFNSTYEKIMAIALRVWRFQRYGLIIEYAQRRSFLFPPFSLIYHLYIFVRWLLSLCHCCAENDQRKHCESGLRMHIIMDEYKKDQLRELENNCLIELTRKRKQEVVNPDRSEPTLPSQKDNEEKRLKEQFMEKLDSVGSKLDIAHDSLKTMGREEAALNHSQMQDRLNTIELLLSEENRAKEEKMLLEESLRSKEIELDDLKRKFTTQEDAFRTEEKRLREKLQQLEMDNKIYLQELVRKKTILRENEQTIDALETRESNNTSGRED